MCIYYKGKAQLSYSSREHIIPKGIGGISTLPESYVSNEFNNDISKLEQEFMRDSFISVPRTFEGPGKRGSLEDRHATKSKVHVILKPDNEDYCALGFSKKAKTFEIPQVKINIITNSFTFSSDGNLGVDFHTIFNQFKSACDNPEKLKIKLIISDRLDENTIILGIQPEIEENYNAYFMKNGKNAFELSHTDIKKIGNSIKYNDPIHQQYQPVSSQSFHFDLKHVRIFGKIAFNFLASTMGESFVMSDKFNKVRNWIAYGSDPILGQLDLTTNPSPSKLGVLPLPDHGHYILLAKHGKYLLARVSLYILPAIITLSDDFHEPFSQKALFCDWKNHQEYDLNEYLRKVHTKEIV